jgi:tRNA(fMet)-specific endonuclease VapC
VVGLSTVSAFELLYPLLHRKLEKQERKVRSFIRQTKLLAFDGEAAEESARIMGNLLKVGEPVNALDVLIAGTALRSGAEKLLSADRDYERIASVSDLQIEMVGKPGG